MKKKTKTLAPRKLGSSQDTSAWAGIDRGITIATPVATLKLDLAAGQSPRDGFEGVDIWPESKHVVDLMKYPWPWADGSVAELHCSHFAEHIPQISVDKLGNQVPMGTPGAQNAFFRFFDECWRVLMPDGWMTVIVPSARSDRAFQDPTHARYINEYTFGYLNATWREENRLDHYGAECFFLSDIQRTVDSLLNAKVAEVANREINNYWNTTIDLHARMKAIKPGSVMPEGIKLPPKWAAAHGMG